MNKLFSAKNLAFLTAGILAFAGSLARVDSVFAQIPGKYLAADVSASDLAIIVSKWPYLVTIGLVIAILIALVNVFVKIKGKSNQ